MMSIAQVRSAGSAGNYYTDKDNYYVLGSMGERWAGRPKILFQLSIGQKSRNVLIISVLGYGEHRWEGGMSSVQLRRTNA